MPEKLPTLLAYLVFPVLASSGFALTYWMIDYGISDIMSYVITSFVFFLAVFFLEKLLPHRQEWVAADGQELHDLGHTLFGTLLGASLGEQLAHLVFTSLGLWAAGKIGHSLWPGFLPFWIQVLMVFLIADLGRYLQHRLLHRYAFFWRFHALHHSVGKLSALKNSRSHFVERFFQPLFLFSLLFLLGAPAQAIMIYLLINSFLGMVDHSNLDARFGPLGYILVGPAEHRLHHSLDFKEGNSNFGSALVIWDMLFGTYVNPRPHHSPQALGIENDPMPASFWGQFFGPFLPAKPSSEPVQLRVADLSENLETV